MGELIAKDQQRGFQRAATLTLLRGPEARQELGRVQVEDPVGQKGCRRTGVRELPQDPEPAPQGRSLHVVADPLADGHWNPVARVYNLGQSDRDRPADRQFRGIDEPVQTHPGVLLCQQGGPGLGQIRRHDRGVQASGPGRLRGADAGPRPRQGGDRGEEILVPQGDLQMAVLGEIGFIETRQVGNTDPKRLECGGEVLEVEGPQPGSKFDGAAPPGRIRLLSDVMCQRGSAHDRQQEMSGVVPIALTLC